MLTYRQPKLKKGDPQEILWSLRTYKIGALGYKQAEESARRFLRIGFVTIGDMTYHRRRVSLRGGKMSASARDAAKQFWVHKAKHADPIPHEQLTPLQKKMQSGGA